MLNLKVQILTHALVKQRELFLETTGIDMMLSNTVSAFTMKHFRTNHIDNDESLALISETGYGLDKYFNQSDIARKYYVI